MNKRVNFNDMYPLIFEMLDNGGDITLKVIGVSMQPMLYNNRDSVTIKRPDAKLKKNDIALFKSTNEQFILHRVKHINSNGSYDFCGDNCWTSEKDIRHEQIIGVVTEFTRNGKKHSVEETLYKLYVFTWPFLHHFKKYYKYLPKFKK